MRRIRQDRLNIIEKLGGRMLIHLLCQWMRSGGCGNQTWMITDNRCVILGQIKHWAENFFLQIGPGGDANEVQKGSEDIRITVSMAEMRQMKALINKSAALGGLDIIETVHDLSILEKTIDSVMGVSQSRRA
jgi:hypothetical protein